jgi:CRISPR-associated endoribonuclease Cas6
MTAPDMLLSSLIELETPHDAVVSGEHLHGWFLQAVSTLDKALASRLHAPARGKPFSLWFGPRFGLGPEGVSRDASDPISWLRVTSVDPDLSDLVGQIVTSPDFAVVRLGRTEFKRSHTLLGGQHPWAGAMMPDDLIARWLTGPPPAGRVRLRFVSPTAFAKSNHSTTLLPVAALVFRSLLKTWNENVTRTVAEPLVTELLNIVQEEAHDLTTTPPRRFRGHQIKGFVGTCEYSCGTKAPEELRRLLHVLADFAFYAGVGLKRTMGMGQVIGESV